MAESDSSVSQTSSVMAHASDGYPSTVYSDANPNAVLSAAENVAVLVESSTSNSTENPNVPTNTSEATDLVAHASDIGAPQQVADTGLTNAAVDSFQPFLSDMAINGNNASEIGNNTATITENGILSDDSHGPSAAHQLFDGSALSAEEERLWSIARANSVDFNAWTALIEETEKMSEAAYSAYSTYGSSYSQQQVPALSSPQPIMAAIIETTGKHVGSIWLPVYPCIGC